MSCCLLHLFRSNALHSKGNARKVCFVFFHVLLRCPFCPEFPHGGNRRVIGADGHDAVPRPLYKVAAPCLQHIELFELIKF